MLQEVQTPQAVITSVYIQCHTSDWAQCGLARRLYLRLLFGSVSHVELLLEFESGQAVLCGASRDRGGVYMDCLNSLPKLPLWVERVDITELLTSPAQLAKFLASQQGKPYRTYGEIINTLPLTHHLLALPCSGHSWYGAELVLTALQQGAIQDSDNHFARFNSCCCTPQQVRELVSEALRNITEQAV